MKSLIGSALCIILISGCKKEMSSSSSSTTQSTNQTSYQEYSPNPDEVIMELEFIKSEISGKMWRNEMKVVRQLKSGFGFKDRIQPGTTIILFSRVKITQDRFYCSAEYQLSTTSQAPKTFVMRQYLTN